MESRAIARRHNLDWLRIMMILTVFIYHSARFFNLEWWHVKNATTYWGVELWEQVLATWMMPLAFVISGATIFYALDNSRVSKFIKDKMLRLVVPLAVGILTHAALQVYLERVYHGEFNGSFLEFYPHYFEGLYGIGGNFAWMGIHLWYLEMLFVFSLIFLPLFLWLKRDVGQRFLSSLGNLLAVPGVILFFLVLPLTLVLNFVDPNSPLGRDDFGGWGILSHAWFFVSGFVLASNERLQQSIQRLRWIWLLAALGSTISQVAYVVSDASRYSTGLQHTDLMSYLWILTFLSWSTKWLNFSTPGLQRANPQVLPFYILHQSVLITIGYFVVQWQIPDLLKWSIITVSSFAVLVGFCEFAVRRYNVLRFLFGMKPLATTAAVQPRETILVHKIAK